MERGGRSQDGRFYCVWLVGKVNGWKYSNVTCQWWWDAEVGARASELWLFNLGPIALLDNVTIGLDAALFT